MVKKIGVFSDLHKSWSELELIVNTFRQNGIDSAMFLGDVLNETMSKITTKRSQELLQIKELLKQDSGLREEVMEGHYSDAQLKKWADGIKVNTELSKKVAKADYEQMEQALDGLNTMVLGGNWGYEQEIKDVFGDAYVNAGVKELEGIKIAGFSGGGSPVNINIPDETLADSDDKHQSEKWQKLLLGNEELGAKIFASHLPFTSGKGKKEETGIEHLKRMYIQRKESGLDVPKVLMHGHKHSTGVVKYDDELEAFIVAPGAGGINHNNNLFPTFMTAEFDDNDDLKKVYKYEIRSSLAGLRNVVLTEEHELDYENNEVKTAELNQTIISEADKKTFKDNLSLDDNHELKGMCNKYDGLDAKEKDELLRRNVAVMFKYIEEANETIRQVMVGAISEADGKISGEAGDKSIKGIYHKLSEEALRKFNANLDHVDEEDKDFYRDIILNVAFGLNPGDIHKLLAKKPKSFDTASKWMNGLIESSSNNLNERYQKHLFNGLEAEDFQEMAELYMPNSFKRTKDLLKDEAISLWINTYKTGILTKEDLSQYEHAYEEDESFVKNPKTEEEIAEMFGIELEKKLETTDDFPEETKDELYEKIANGEVPVIKGDDEEDYVKTQNGDLKVGDELKNNVEYTSKTENEVYRDLIKDGKMPVVERNGQEFLPSKGMQAFNPQNYGLQKGEYNTIPFDSYLRQMLSKNGDLQAEDKVKPMELDMEDSYDSPIERPNVG